MAREEYLPGGSIYDQVTSSYSTVTVTDHGALAGLGDDDHTQYQKESEKGSANGYCGLDGTTKVATANLGTGSASAATYLRGDRTWASVSGAQAFPVGSVFIAVVDTDPATLLGYGTWSAFGAGRVLVGVNAGDADFNEAEEIGGSKTNYPAGTNSNESSHTHSVTSNVSVDNHASHTHDYTQVVNHTHSVNVGSAADTSTTTGAGNYFAGTTSSVAATTGNPSGGVETGTTTGPSATLTHSVTNNAVTSGAGSSHTHTFTGSAMSVVQPYIVVYMWKRTA